MSKEFDPQIIEDIFVIDSENIYESQLVQQCFDIVGVFVAAVDLKGNITLINKKGRELLGYREDEIVGKNFIEHFITHEEQKRTKAFFHTVLQNQSAYPEGTHYHLRTCDNENTIVEAKNITIRNKSRDILGILISGEDITGYIKSQHDLQKDLNLYRILANNIPDINLYLFDKDLRFILAEGAEMKNNGFTHHYFEGKRLRDISCHQTIEIWEPLFSLAIEGKSIHTEYKYNNYYYLLWVIPLKNSSSEGYSGIAITQNITDDKLTQQQLKRSKEEAEKANQAKSDFLARVSHEIRTPLNAILGFTEQLKQTSLGKRQFEYLKIIDKSSEHLLSLINDILILSKIEARQISFDDSPFKIKNTVEYVYKTLYANADEKNLRFIYDVDTKLDKVLLGDSFRLRQILINMLTNAIKFTHSGHIELRCFMLDETDTEIKVRFDIIDTGIGINAKNIETIFKQFKQADSSISKKYGGTGLGLTICKNLIELQNGSLSVTSQENIGTTFTFIIPYQKGNETQIIPNDLGKIDAKKLKNRKVLLVDDDSVNRLLGKTILEKFGCSFVIANNGKEAIDLLNKNKYDIVLLDIHMPDISGIEVAKYLRFEKHDNTTKIVAVTAAVMKDDLRHYLQAGINDFIVKPFKEIHIFNKMCDMLQNNTQAYIEPKEEEPLKEETYTKLYNLEALRKMTSDNEAMVNLLNTFIENSESAVQEFQQLLKNKNWKQIGEAAHKILPSYKHLRVGSIISDLTDIKIKTLVEPEYKTVPPLVKNVIREMLRVISELRREVQQLSS